MTRACPRVFPLHAVAALFIERQHLDRPRARRLTAASLTSFAESAGAIQLDTINVVERAHYLTAWSRFGAYDKTAFDRLAYAKRTLFEYWAHAACLVPIAHYPAWRRVMLDYAGRSWHWAAWRRKHGSVIARVESAIRERGPLGSADFEGDRPGKRGEGWWNRKHTTHALDWLWTSGVVSAHSRVHFQKRYDLTKRVLPRSLAAEPLSSADFGRWHVRQSLRAMGAATQADLRMYLTIPHFKPAERRAVLESMLANEEVVEVSVEVPVAEMTRRPASARRGAPRWFALSEDLPALARAARQRAPRGTTLLSPFDSFLWHRERTLRIFGFDYRIEVYVPGHKRVHGYYALPILHDGQLIGRLDSKTHREEGRLEVKSVHFERWFANGARPPAARWGEIDREAAIAGLGESIRSLAQFVGASRITLGRVYPAKLRPALARALR